MADAFLGQGVNVTILAPDRDQSRGKDFWKEHDVSRKVKVRYLPVTDWINSRFVPGLLALRTLHRSFAKSLNVALKEGTADVLYTRDPILLPLLLKDGRPVGIELHRIPRFGKKGFAKQCAKCRVVVCLTSVMADVLTKLGVPRRKILIAPDAVDLDEFTTLPTRAAARKALNVPADCWMLGYAGSLETMGLSKGIEHLIDAVQRLTQEEKNMRVIIAGGPASAMERLERRAKRRNVDKVVRFLGHVPRTRVKEIYAAADVLLYTAPKSRHVFFQRDTSPLKLFEYFASGRPVVAADIPPIRDIADEKTAVLYTPGSVAHLAEMLQGIRRAPAGAVRRATAARTRVRSHTWENRADIILDRLTLQ
jgi:glycosyltransferase involved in cell wall biosynthesis